jgi:RHH-type proline utilization regulon transcriptional repressor/proline dehydrogenase/delta 1-pyrroline-5-carboxylate dehydrogenase
MVTEMATTTFASSATHIPDLEPRIQAIGHDLFRRIGRGAAPWQRAWWDDRFMAMTMSDPAVKVQLFRFIDALPALKDATSVRRHLREFLDEAGPRVPSWMDAAIELAPAGSMRAEIFASAATWAATNMARRFIAGSDPREALETVLSLRKQGMGFTADLLGEAVISESEADAYQKSCLDLIRGLADPLASEPERSTIDRGHDGPVPRVNLSLKLTSLTPHFDSLHAEATAAAVLDRLRPILREAMRLGAYVHVDMEQYAHKDLTIDIFKEILSEPEFRDWPDAGVVAQAYLHETLDDLKRLGEWAKMRGTPVTIRLVKGAYWDYEVIHAREAGWPIPVYTEKWQSDANYERCSRFLMDHWRVLRPALASHNVRSLAAGIGYAEATGVPSDAYELQVLHGMGEPIARALASLGHRVRVYTPYGAILPGMAYLVRRLLENTSNESFLKASFVDGRAVDDLLKNPEEVGKMLGFQRRAKNIPEVVAPGPFRNEPLTDFTREPAREAMRAALARVERELGRTYPLKLNGREISTVAMLDSTDPGQSSRLVGRFAKATAEHAALAVRRAREVAPQWAARPAAERAGVLLRAAAILRGRKFELAAWEVFECAKPWREADGDIAEAIDFCEFYAREMLRLAQPVARDVPGETNRIEVIPRGVAVVIPPWNFPLAIPCGMTVAALVAGNPVILKPAEQSPAIAWQLVKALDEAGLPAGVLQFLPGDGEEVGRALVEDPGVDLIAFTGSVKVGLEINRSAAQSRPGTDHVKRVIAEMGGKNAIIVDDDADLDEAVLGVIRSAFGYSGQKCSACSRVIVLDRVYDAFVARLAEAARAVVIGQASDPETVIGPLIDADAAARVLAYSKLAESEGRIVARGNPGPLVQHGHFVAPIVVADVLPTARIAQEEIFGPVLAILRAADLEDAIRIANETAFALTGGIYSRSPANIERIRQSFRVGNLYINRPITGALVDRQPFGGFKLSGIGTKAGGSDYLREFLLTRTVTENTLRRGFAPEGELGTAATPSAGI